MQKITGINHLKEIASVADGELPVEIVLRLAPCAKTTKYIQYDAQEVKPWYVRHMIDDTEAYYTTQELAEQTNIVTCIEQGTAYFE